MKEKKIEEFSIDGKIYVDVKGASIMLERAEGTIRNMTHMKYCPSYIKRGTKLYFEKDSLQEFRKERQVIKIN